MNLLKQGLLISLVFSVIVSALVAQTRKPRKADTVQQPPANVVALHAKIRRFSPTVLTADTSRLSANDRKALQKIIAAAKYMDPLFRRQVWSGNEALLTKLEAYKDPAWARYFRINSGPWSRLDHNELFVHGQGVPAEKPKQANYYPSDMTKDEF